MRSLVTPEEMVDNRDMLKVVFSDFRILYNKIAKEKKGVISPETFDSIIATIISTIQDDKKPVSEAFLEFVLRFMVMNTNNSVDAFRTIDKLFGW